MPQIRRHGRPHTPVVLCGCQADAREASRDAVTSERALAACCDAGAANYVETSAAAGEVIEALEVGA